MPPASVRTRHLRLRAAIAASGGVLLALSACGSSPDDTSSTSAAVTTTAAASAAQPSSADAGISSAGAAAPAPATASITIKDFAYGDPITVAPGTVVTVTNEDTAKHDVVPKDGTSWTMELLDQGASGTFTAPTAPGSYAFTCSIHPKMAGTLIVSG